MLRRMRGGIGGRVMSGGRGGNGAKGEEEDKFVLEGICACG